MEDELRQRLGQLNNEIILEFCSGVSSSWANKDIIEYAPGKINKIDDLLSRRNEVIGLLDKLKNK